MSNKNIPLEEISIATLFMGDSKSTYEVPVYQRNYAWGKDEISALIQDVYDSFQKDNTAVYYIGTLVSFNRGDSVFEVIDGQQRLTTIRIILGVLGIAPTNHLTYSAREKSDKTLKSIPEFKTDKADFGIVNGYKFAETAINEIVSIEQRKEFKDYFLQKVHIIHYQVPKDIDLNHYFEIMNSRGEQLEKHEIIKARLLDKLKDNPKESNLFAQIWGSCSKMSVYLQQSFSIGGTKIFGKDLTEFKSSGFEDILLNISTSGTGETKKIIEYINNSFESFENVKGEKEHSDTFQPIIDFSNFLLIVLKITRMEESDFIPTEFNLDDKELINEFDKITLDEEFVKKFGYNLFKAKYYLDNFIVHHTNEEDTIDNNPWALQKFYYDNNNKKYYPKNLFEEDDDSQIKAVQLLSMFEVSFTARQRKNYLFYCLLYLFRNNIKPYNTYIGRYLQFIEGLAKKYFYDIYLDQSQLNEINTPLPGSFDDKILDSDNKLNTKITHINKSDFSTRFKDIYGDGIEMSKGVPLFVFNYIDYKIWKKYADELRGEKSKKGSSYRKQFFDELGCSDFELDIFRLFYFSRTRRSLEHYYPQATATGENGTLDQNQINCLGNYSMIGSEVNSSGSNWSPSTKLIHYLDTTSGKVKLISVASLKFMIMMQICRDHVKAEDRTPGQEWNFEDIKNHQEKMIDILFN